MEISRNFELSQKLTNFIIEHANDDPATLRLKFSNKENVISGKDLHIALLQIEARKKTRKKIPTFIANRNFLFPTLVSAEQASNEAVARFHASLVPKHACVLDMTGGLGIDAMSFAMHGCDVSVCELEQHKCDVLKSNIHALGLEDKMDLRCGDSVAMLEEDTRHYDMIFIDPARRGDGGQRVHALADCQPDVLKTMPTLRQKGDRILIKASPLLDLTLIKNSVENLHHIYVVCFRGECKEVLMEISDQEYDGISVVDLDWEREISRFETKPDKSSANDSQKRETALPTTSNCMETASQEKPSASLYTYLYEPNPGVMKTGAWGALKAQYPDLTKADPNTHLFLSDTLYNAFPGRVVRIASAPDKKALKRLKGTHINTVSRNHPLSAPQIAAKFGTTAGGEDFLYAFRWHNSPSILLCKPL